MQYQTKLISGFRINGVVEDSFVDYIKRFSYTRHFRRSNAKIKKLHPDWKDHCFEGELGIEGEYYVCKFFSRDQTIERYYAHAITQPDFFCHWIIEKNESGKYCLTWDGDKDFPRYDHWLKYMVKNFFVPKNLELNGVVLAIGAEYTDAQYLIMRKNRLYIFDAWDKDSAKRIKSSFSNDKIIMKDFDKVYLSPEQIAKYFWEKP